jgi:hypothetical protein
MLAPAPDHRVKGASMRPLWVLRQLIGAIDRYFWLRKQRRRYPDVRPYYGPSIAFHSIYPTALPYDPDVARHGNTPSRFIKP